MFVSILGLILVVVGCGSFWFLLPRGGSIHPLVDRWDGGSMITLIIMTVVTIGITLSVAGILG